MPAARIINKTPSAQPHHMPDMPWYSRRAVSGGCFAFCFQPFPLNVVFLLTSAREGGKCGRLSTFRAAVDQLIRRTPPRVFDLIAIEILLSGRLQTPGDQRFLNRVYAPLLPFYSRT